MEVTTREYDALIARNTAKIKKEYEEKIESEFKAFMSRIETKLIMLDERHTQVSTTLTKNTDPTANNKSSFWINIRAGAIYFVAGLIAGPVGSILLKRPLDNLDKWLNGPDIPVIAQSAPPMVQKIASPLEPEKQKGKDAAVVDPPASQPETLTWQLENSGLNDPATGRFPNLLNTRPVFSIIGKNPAPACQRPVPPIVCVSQSAHIR